MPFPNLFVSPVTIEGKDKIQEHIRRMEYVLYCKHQKRNNGTNRN